MVAYMSKKGQWLPRRIRRSCNPPHRRGPIRGVYHRAGPMAGSGRTRWLLRPTLPSQTEHEDHRGAAAEVALLRRGRKPAHGVAGEAGGDGDVLLAIDRVGHRRRVDAGADIEAPQ